MQESGICPDGRVHDIRNLEIENSSVPYRDSNVYHVITKRNISDTSQPLLFVEFLNSNGWKSSQRKKCLENILPLQSGHNESGF